MPDGIIRDLVLKRVAIPFKSAFRHASAERAETLSLWVEATSRNGVTGYGESCPRPYVTGETPDTARTFFLRHQSQLVDEIDGLASLRTWMAKHSDELDANPAAWCAIELAILDMLAKEEDRTIESFLSLPPLRGCFHYTAVLGDADTTSFKASTAQYLHHGFTDFKLKLSGNLERDQAKIAVMREWKGAAFRVRVDANNLWKTGSEATAFLRKLDYPFFAIEEPLQPNSYAELAGIADAFNCKIILDESFLRINQFAVLSNEPNRWLINARVSKLGGLLRTLDIIETARARNIGLIVGAQVGETSLLTRAGLTAAHAASNKLLAQEGAFGTFLLERDICNPPLMFGKAGVLDSANYPLLDKPGFGFELASNPGFLEMCP